MAHKRSELHSLGVCFCRPAAGTVMGFSQLKKAEPLPGIPPSSLQEQAFVMIPHDSSVGMARGPVIVFTLIFTCERCSPTPDPQLGEFLKR